MRDAIILEYVTLLNVKHCKMDIRLAIELNTKAIYTHLPQRQFDLSVTLQSITAEHGSFGAIIRNENKSKGRFFHYYYHYMYTTTTTSHHHHYRRRHHHHNHYTTAFVITISSYIIIAITLNL